MKETLHYAEISQEELKQIEAEFGHPVSQELALWFIRNRMNRDAVERMLNAEDSSGIHLPSSQRTCDEETPDQRSMSQKFANRQITREIKRTKTARRGLPTKKCA